MGKQTEPIRKQMANHLQKITEDWENFGWPMVRAYHAAWLQHLEQGTAILADDDIRLKLKRVLIWHSAASDLSAHT